MTESSLDARCRVIRELLARYHELVDPLNGPGGVRGDGEAVALMPRTYTASVRELERIVRGMRDNGHQLVRLGDLVDGLAPAQQQMRLSVRALWWQINARYIAAPVRIAVTEVTEKVLDKHGRVKRGRNGEVLMEVKKRRAPEPLLDPRVNEKIVSAAVAWMAGAWSLASEPMLPRNLLVAA